MYKGKILFSGKRLPPGSIDKKAFVKTAITSIVGHSKQLSVLQYVFVNNAQILEINKTHLQHNYFTDVITFDLSENKESVNAEIYISIDTVRSNAEIYNCPFAEELARVMFHGLLHLLGFNDKTSAQKKQMRLMENQCLNLYRETSKN